MSKIAKFSLKGLIVKILFYLKSAYLAQLVHFLPGQLPALPCRMSARVSVRNWLEPDGGAGSLLLTVVQPQSTSEWPWNNTTS